jgi:hypothetical protein
VQDDDWKPLGIAALLDIDTVAIANVEKALIEGLDLRIKKCDCALMTGDAIHGRTI